MEHLTKQQIVLLTLLVSFVTSIATGIVTVSLLDQAPSEVTQTINRVIERTIERASSPEQTASVGTKTVVSFEDQTAIAAEKMSDSLVRIKPRGRDSSYVTGLGLVLSKDGVIVVDKASLPTSEDYLAVFSDGQEFPVRVVQSQINGDIVFLVAVIPDTKKATFVMTPISFASSIKLGQTVFVLSGKDSNVLAQGIISKVEGSVGTTTSVTAIRTTVPSSNILIGSPLFNIAGEVIGLKTTSLGSVNETAFYPLSILKSTIPVLPR